jgi:hypothetical protein
MADEVRVYNLVWCTDEAGDRDWYECPVCGTLTTAEAREHGPTHVLPASTPWAPPARIIADARRRAEQ